MSEGCMRKDVLVWVVGAGLVLFLANSIYQRGKSDALAKARADSIQVMMVKLDSVRAVVVERDSSVVKMQRVLQAVKDSAANAAADHAAQGDSVYERIVEVVPDSVKVLVDSMRSQHVAEVNAYKTQIAASARLLSLERQRVAARDTLIAQLQTVNDNLHRMWQDAEHRASPPWYKTALKVAPYVGGAAVLGAILF